MKKTLIISMSLFLALLLWLKFSNRDSTWVYYFDDCEPFKMGLAKVSKNGKWGYINPQGEEIVAINFDQYDLSSINDNGIISIKKSDKWIFIDTTGNEIKNTEKKIIKEEVKEEVFGLISFCVEEPNVLDILQRVHVTNWKWGFKNKKGEIIVPNKYDNVGNFKEGLAVVEIDHRAGFINTDGKEIIYPQYDDWFYGTGNAYELYGFSEGLSPVCKESKWGFIDKTGTPVIPFEYDWADEFHSGFANVRKGSKWGLLDKQGKEIIAIQYDNRINQQSLFTTGIVKVSKNGKWGFMDMTGSEIISLKYDEVGNFSEGLVRVAKGGKWGFVDENGNEVVSLDYDEVGDFSEGLASVVKDYGKEVLEFQKTKIQLVDYKWGFVDRNGKKIISLKYDKVGSFSNGLAKVCKRDKKEMTVSCVFIDKNENVVLPQQKR